MGGSLGALSGLGSGLGTGSGNGHGSLSISEKGRGYGSLQIHEEEPSTVPKSTQQVDQEMRDRSRSNSIQDQGQVQDKQHNIASLLNEESKVSETIDTQR